MHMIDLSSWMVNITSSADRHHVNVKQGRLSLVVRRETSLTGFLFFCIASEDLSGFCLLAEG